MDLMLDIYYYVDDIVPTASSQLLRQAIISKLNKEFAMKYLGPLSYFLGISVQQHASGLFLSQQKYASEIIERANMSGFNSSSIHMDTGSKLSASSGPPVKNPMVYRSLTGALQYLTFTRLDISYAVQQIFLFMHDPREPHTNMFFIFVNPIGKALWRTPMSTGAGVRIPVDPRPVIAFSWELTCSRGLPNTNLPFPGQVLKLSIAASLMLFRKRVGYEIFC